MIDANFPAKAESGFSFSRDGRESQSIVFLSTAEYPLLYSGDAMRSACAGVNISFSFSAFSG